MKIFLTVNEKLESVAGFKKLCLLIPPSLLKIFNDSGVPWGGYGYPGTTHFVPYMTVIETCDTV